MWPTFIPVRLPLGGVNPFDPEDVREGLQRWLDLVVPLEGQPTPAIHVYFDGHREVLELPRVLMEDPEADPGATFEQMSRHSGARCAVMVAILEHAVGDLAAAAIGVDQGSSWWAVLRPYKTTPEGLGAWGGEWETTEGTGPLPAAFAPILLPTPGGRPARLLPARPPDPDIRIAVFTFPDEARLPTTAMEMTEFAAASTMPTVEREGFNHARIICLRGRECEVWEVRGRHLPSTMDDLVRYICQYGAPAKAVAAAVAGQFIEDGQRRKAVRIQAEMGDRRAERVFTLRLPPGGGRLVRSRTHCREGNVQPGRGWLGVDPMVRWELHARSSAGHAS